MGRLGGLTNFPPYFYLKYKEASDKVQRNQFVINETRFQMFFGEYEYDLEGI